MHSESIRPARANRLTRLTRPSCIALLSLSLGYFAASGWSHRAELAEWYLQAAEQKYQIMAGEIGPVTYLVTQSDYHEFEAAALSHEGVLGVEIHDYPDVAAIAFVNADDPAIDVLRQHETVSAMKKKFVPMICH